MSEGEASIVFWLWTITLIVLVVVIVPLAVHLLSRASSAARNTRRYAEEMLAAGASIASHTANITALDATIGTAGALVATSNELEALARGLRSTLVARS